MPTQEIDYGRRNFLRFGGVILAGIVTAVNFPTVVFGRRLSDSLVCLPKTSWTVEEVLNDRLNGRWTGRFWDMLGLGIWTAPDISEGNCLICVNNLLPMGFGINISSIRLRAGDTLELINGQTGQTTFLYSLPFRTAD